MISAKHGLIASMQDGVDALVKESLKLLVYPGQGDPSRLNLL